MKLFNIQQLVKKDIEAGSKEIVSFIEKKFPNTEVSNIKEIKINSSAVSVNSVNGFIETELGKEYFFKFHSEENEEDTVNEYYKSSILGDNGFSVLKPVFMSTKPGEQFLIYDKVKDKTMYELWEKIDLDFLNIPKNICSSCNLPNIKNDNEKISLEKILKIEKEFSKSMNNVFQKTKKEVSSDIVEKEAIWQLFYYRLVGKESRVNLFYKDKFFKLPNGNKISFEKIKDLKWEINGVLYKETISELINVSKKIINPKYKNKWTTCVAHGDDHNGNKFYRKNRDEIEYFDPAFAGENIPIILAPVKTTFHDVFAHPFYFYSDKTVLDKLKLEFKIEKNIIKIKHNFDLEKVAPHRIKLLKIKFDEIWKPIFSDILEKDKKKEIDFVKKALFNSSFLCKNLIDDKNFEPQTSLLTLSIAVQLGTYVENEYDFNLIDEFLKNI